MIQKGRLGIKIQKGRLGMKDPDRKARDKRSR